MKINRNNMTTKIKKEGTSGPPNINVLNANTKIEGTIQTADDFRLEGSLKGDFISTAKIVIGQTGKITGNIKAGNADIAGTIEGKLEINGILNLKSTGKIIGEVKTKKLVIEEGGIFDVKCDMSNGHNANQKQDLGR